MKKLMLMAAILIFVGTACGPGGDSVEVECPPVEECEPEIVEVTRIVTKEIEVTRMVKEDKKSETPTKSSPVSTPTKQESIEEIRANIIQSTISAVEILDGVERVNLVRLEEGIFEIEIQTVWASQDNQPEISWLIVTLLASGLSQTDPGQRWNLTGSEDLTLVITSFSTKGEYKYKSETDFDTLVQVNNRSISYEEWILLANAGFR